MNAHDFDKLIARLLTRGREINVADGPEVNIIRFFRSYPNGLHCAELNGTMSLPPLSLMVNNAIPPH